MTKVHITLVGGQPAPVYNGIVAMNSDKVVYILFSGKFTGFRSIEKGNWLA